jgi:hypothetical protein
MSTTTNFVMPRPNLGDTVLFSSDMSYFTNPSVGWVTSVGETTISILTITPGGFIQRTSVHHRSDPDLLGDHGWQDLGCWDYAESQKAVNELMAPPKVETSRGRATTK